MFTSKINTMTGKLDWEILGEDYDYQQELGLLFYSAVLNVIFGKNTFYFEARAGFADMLHDYERV